MATDGDLSKEDLLLAVDAVRAMSHVGASGDYDRMVLEALRTACLVTGSDRVVIYWLDDSGKTLVRGGSEPEAPSVEQFLERIEIEGTWMGRSLETLKALSVTAASLPPDRREALCAAGIVHAATLPLHIRGRPTGALLIGRQTDRPYTARELRIAEILSDLLVVHLENARLLTDASSRLDEMRMLLDVARTITATLSLDTRLEASAQALARLIDASNAFILLLDSDGRTLQGVSSSGPELRALTRSIRIPVTAASIAARAVRALKTVTVEDAERDPEVNQDLVHRLGEKSLLSLPLLANGEPIGAVVIDDTRRTRVWGSTEIERAELIATQVATAVTNARLFEEVKQSYEQLARAQEELVKRERLAALGQLSATLAHEVRNPLGVLYNSLGTLGKMLPKTGDVATLLSIMGEETQRLDRLVGELLDFGRPVLPALEPHSLVDVVDGALRAAAQQLGPEAATLSSEVPTDFPPLSIDHAMMRRALVNLLVNGSQAAGSRGSVAIRSSIQSRSGKKVGRIDVSDTGPGIPPTIANRVFEPFFTTKATGTGLGLAIVKSIIEAHGGEIELASADGSRGTRVTLLLPIDANAEPTERT
jgi:two-component system, NtrC family, sensor histidine kinase HydH